VSKPTTKTRKKTRKKSDYAEAGRQLRAYWDSMTPEERKEVLEKIHTKEFRAKKSETFREIWAKKTAQERSDIAKAREAKIGSEARSQIIKNAQAKTAPEAKAEWRKAQSVAQAMSWATMTPEEREARKQSMRKPKKKKAFIP
jgi:hypothetical protein